MSSACQNFFPLHFSHCATPEDPAWTPLCSDKIIYLFTVWLAWELSRVWPGKWNSKPPISLTFASGFPFSAVPCEWALFLGCQHCFWSFPQCFSYFPLRSKKRPSRPSTPLNSTPKHANVQTVNSHLLVFFMAGWFLVCLLLLPFSKDEIPALAKNLACFQRGKNSSALWEIITGFKSEINDKLF